MAYEKQNFTNGQILTAEHLNYIEDGIEEIAEQTDIYVGESEAEANDSGAIVWVNPEEVRDDSYVTEDYVLKAMSYKAIKVNNPAAIGSASKMQAKGAETTQVYSSVYYNTDPEMFSYDETTGVITIHRDGYYQLRASAALRISSVESSYGVMRIKYDKTAIGGTVGNTKSFQVGTCVTADGVSTAYFEGDLVYPCVAETKLRVDIGCPTQAWYGNTGGGYCFEVVYLGN